MDSINSRIANELGVRPQQVAAAVALLDEGSTVPFIARYRKEVTGGLDDTQLRNLEERLGYLRELEDRRATVIASIDEQGKLTDALRAEVENADTKQRLEDLYLPYKPKRRTKAQIAREAGIAPLAEALLADPTLNPEAEAAAYLNEEAGFADTKSVLDGARQILIEQFAEDAELLGTLRSLLHDDGEHDGRFALMANDVCRWVFVSPPDVGDIRDLECSSARYNRRIGNRFDAVVSAVEPDENLGTFQLN